MYWLIRAFESNGQSGRVFDYPAFLAKDGILYTMDRAGIEVVGHGEGNWLQEKLFCGEALVCRYYLTDF